jgi:hypothetical protein
VGEFSGRSRGNAWELDTLDKALRNGGAITSEFLKKPMLKKGFLKR